MAFSFTRNRRTMRFSAALDDVARSLADPGGTVLAVWAHAADAVLLAGGLLSAAAEAGIQVVEACAVRSPADGPPAIPAPDGTDDHRVGLFDDPHVSIPDVPKVTGVRAVAHLLATHRPDSVVSFGPDGVTGDPEHRVVARWVARAVAAVEPDRHLAHLVTDVAAHWPEDLVGRMHLAGSFRPGFPVRRPTGEGTEVIIEGGDLERKVEALDGHTHFGPLHEVLGDHGVRRLAAVESYAAMNEAASYRLRSLATRGEVSAGELVAA